MWVMWPVLKVHFVAKETGQYSGKMMKKRKAQVFLCRNSTQTIYDFACHQRQQGVLFFKIAAS